MSTALSAECHSGNVSLGVVILVSVALLSAILINVITWNLIMPSIIIKKCHFTFVLSSISAERHFSEWHSSVILFNVIILSATPLNVIAPKNWKKCENNCNYTLTAQSKEY